MFYQLWTRTGQNFGVGWEIVGCRRISKIFSINLKGPRGQLPRGEAAHIPGKAGANYNARRNSLSCRCLSTQREEFFVWTRAKRHSTWWVPEWCYPLSPSFIVTWSCLLVWRRGFSIVGGFKANSWQRRSLQKAIPCSCLLGDPEEQV